jgi:acetyl-CoA carboxylase/biotin carboxylase 1
LEKLDITATVTRLKGESLARRLVAVGQEDRKAALDALVRLMNNLPDDDRSHLLDALANSNRSPGGLTLAMTNASTDVV